MVSFLLILRKIIKIATTICHILKLKCTKFDFGWGSATDPAGGAYSAPPDSLAVFKGPTSKGRGREGMGRRRGQGRGPEGRRAGWEGKGDPCLEVFPQPLYRRIRGDMIEVYKILTNKYDSWEL